MYAASRSYTSEMIAERSGKSQVLGDLLIPPVAVTLGARGAPAPSKKPILLFVDDESLKLSLFKIVMEMALGDCLQVLTADNGQAALQLLEEHARDVGLLMTDMRMPGMDGNELAAEARNKLPDLPVAFYVAEPRDVQELPNSIVLDKTAGTNWILDRIRSFFFAAPEHNASPTHRAA